MEGRKFGFGIYIRSASKFLGKVKDREDEDPSKCHQVETVERYIIYWTV